MIGQHEMGSVVTCDLEGRIETYDEGAEHLFGYAPEEVIGHKRISLFSPGKIFLEHVGKWLEAARSDGAFETSTVLVRKDGTRFAAHVIITPTYGQRDGHRQHVGYRGTTRILPSRSPEEVMPSRSWLTRILSWIVITRAPFLTASLMPMMVAAAWVGWSSLTGGFPWGLFTSALLGAVCLHVAANTFNDYFDWRSGTDPVNNDYFAPYSGGSRAIELGLISERSLVRLATTALLLAVPAALPVLLARGPFLLVFGLAGAALAYFYTAPPLRLSARRGLGELSVMLSFGPLLSAGTVYALTGAVEASTFLIGVPMGLLAGAILWVNEFPDAETDAMTGKNHLLVTLGKRAGRWGYAMLVGAAFLSAVWLIWARVYPYGAIVVLLAAPLGVHATRIVLTHYLDRELVRASRATIQLHALCGLLLCAAMVWEAY